MTESTEIDAIFERDAELFRVISRHAWCLPVWASLGALQPEQQAEPARKQADAALLAAIRRKP